MKKESLIVIGILAVTVIVVYFFAVRRKGDIGNNNIVSTTTIVVASNDNSTASKIENWSLYQEITDLEEKWVGSGDCSDPSLSPNEFAKFKTLAISGSMKQLVLPGNLYLIITPNYFSWSNENFLGFNSDPNAICAVAGRYPLIAYSDKLLWRGVCSTGLQPDINTPAYDELIQCEKSREAVDKYFKLR